MAPGGDPAARLDRLEHALRATRLPLEETVPLVAALLSVPWAEHYPPLDLESAKTQAEDVRSPVAWLMAEAERQPVLAVWEDLHGPIPRRWSGLAWFWTRRPPSRCVTC